MHYYLKLCVFSVIIVHINLQKEETNRVIVYNSFEEYKNSLNKTYAREFEEVRSRRAYEENCKTIEEHNELFKKGKTKFILRANCFADLTSQQYLRKHVRLERSLRPEKEPESTASSVTHLGSVELPQSLDWRDKGFITPPDNQRSCGSCYAYSICQSIEGQVYKRTGELISLSEQQIVDCSKVIGNHGCGGGSLRGTLEYLEKYGGLMRRQDYPYMAKEGKCQFVPALSIVNVTAWAILPSDNEDAIQVALATIGPVAVSINASPKTFQLYSEGIYDDENCPSDKVNHAMLAIGYTPDFWILKNWWGKDWGDDGYMKIRRNKNLCGIATYAAYAIV